MWQNRPIIEWLNELFPKYPATEKKAVLIYLKYLILALMEQVSSRICVKSLSALATKFDALTITQDTHLILMFT